MSKYTKTQIIAVEYKTGVSNPQNNVAPTRWAKAPSYPQPSNEELQLISEFMQIFEQHWENAKIGLSNNKQDLIDRLTYYAYVSAQILGSVSYDISENTLKCILWPEFYWCPSATGAYTKEEYRVLKNTLREALQGPRFNNTLIVNGTIIWELKDGEARSSKSAWAAPHNTHVYFNTALIVHNGSNALTYYSKRNGEVTGKNSFTLQKMYMSGIDGVPGYKFNSFEREDNTVFSANQTDYYQTIAAQNKHVFKIGQLKIGLEICLEHTQTMLSKAIFSIFEEAKINKNANILDIQLLTACGMDEQSSFIFTRNNGVFGRTDGSRPNSSCVYRAPADIDKGIPNGNTPMLVEQTITNINGVLARVYPTL